MSATPSGAVVGFDEDGAEAVAPAVSASSEGEGASAAASAAASPASRAASRPPQAVIRAAVTRQTPAPRAKRSKGMKTSKRDEERRSEMQARIIGMTRG